MNTVRRDGEDCDQTRADASDDDLKHLPLNRASSELVRTSQLAIAACVAAMLSLLLVPGLIRVASKSTPPHVRDVYQAIAFAAGLCAAVLGAVSLVRIGLSAGRLVGRAFAWIGITAPVLQYLLWLFVILPAIPHSSAFRMTCGGNLARIGKAMVIYANDYEDEFPRAGGPGSQWTGRIPNWIARDRFEAYGLISDGSGGQVSVSASLYLLVKYGEVKPKSFICYDSKEMPEKGVTEFKLRTYSVPDGSAELIDFYDFGPDPTRHVSYAYHMVYGPHRLSLSCEPGMAVAADRNPWTDSPSAKAKDFSLFKPDMTPFGGSAKQGRYGNTFRHQQRGQQVLFADTHVEFARRPWCGLENDNIYTSWDGDDKVRGKPPKVGSTPAGPTDSLLVNDPIQP